MANKFMKETYRIIEMTDASDYNGLSDANKAAYNMIISAGIVELTEGAVIRDKLWNMFDDQSTTGIALRADCVDDPTGDP